MITVVEIAGGALLAAGFLVLPLSGWFAFQLLMRIYLIHGRVGWFTVGAGRNGMEFSVFLLLCLSLIALTRDFGIRTLADLGGRRKPEG